MGVIELGEKALTRVGFGWNGSGQPEPPVDNEKSASLQGSLSRPTRQPWLLEQMYVVRGSFKEVMAECQSTSSRLIGNGEAETLARLRRRCRKCRLQTRDCAGDGERVALHDAGVSPPTLEVVRTRQHRRTLPPSSHHPSPDPGPLPAPTSSPAGGGQNLQVRRVERAP